MTGFFVSHNEQRVMEKEKLLSAVKTGLGTTGLSERTISEYVDNILPDYKDVAELTEDITKKHVGILKTIEGQKNFEVANAVNDFKSKWEKDHPAKTQETKEDDAITKLTAEIEALKKANKDANDKNAIAVLVQKVKAKGEELKVSNRAIWDDAFNKVQVGSETTEEQLLEKVKQTYEADLKRYLSDGVKPYGGAGTGSPDVISDDEAKARREAYKAKKRAEGKLPLNQN